MEHIQQHVQIAANPMRLRSVIRVIKKSPSGRVTHPREHPMHDVQWPSAKTKCLSMEVSQ